MDRIIANSNIVFSAILNLNSNIGQILINGKDYYDFYCPKYVRTELFKHKAKIKKITALAEREFQEVYQLVLQNITVLDHSILPEEDFKKELEYCRDIDIDDSIFVGFSEYLKSELWTGDKVLTKGLLRKGFRRIMSTEQLFKDFIQKSRLKE